MNLKVTVPETAEGKRAFVEGLGAAVNRIQSYAVELFLRGQPGDEVAAERLRDMANDLLLEGGKHISDALKLEAAAAAREEKTA